MEWMIYLVAIYPAIGKCIIGFGFLFLVIGGGMFGFSISCLSDLGNTNSHRYSEEEYKKEAPRLKFWRAVGVLLLVVSLGFMITSNLFPSLKNLRNSYFLVKGYKILESKESNKRIDLLMKKFDKLLGEEEEKK